MRITYRKEPRSQKTVRRFNANIMSNDIEGPAPVEGTVAVTFEGRDVTASYNVAHGMVTVHTEKGSKTTWVGHFTADLLARLMLRELAREGKV